MSLEGRTVPGVSAQQVHPEWQRHLKVSEKQSLMLVPQLKTVTANFLCTVVMEASENMLFTAGISFLNKGDL